MKPKKIHFFLLLIFFTSCSGTEINEKIENNNKLVDYSVYEEVLKDSSNFFLFPEDKFSDIKYIIQENKRWKKERFFISGNNIIGSLLRDEDELSDYNTTYLFSKNEGYVSNKEKRALASYSQKILSDTIEFDFINLIEISKYDSFEGMCFNVSQPIVSSDKKAVFLDVFIHKNLSKRTLDTTNYYEKVGFILEKDSIGKWKTIERKIWIMF